MYFAEQISKIIIMKNIKKEIRFLTNVDNQKSSEGGIRREETRDSNITYTI